MHQRCMLLSGPVCAGALCASLEDVFSFNLQTLVGATGVSMHTEKTLAKFYDA